MNLKKTLPALTLMVALLFAVSTAMAQPPETGAKKPPKKIQQMSPEDHAAWAELWKEHRVKIEPLRDQMWAKRMEYDFLAANPNTKPDEVKALINEMLALKGQLRAEKNKLADAAHAKGLKGHWFGPRGWRGPGPDGDCVGFGGRGPGKGFGRHHGGPMMDD